VNRVLEIDSLDFDPDGLVRVTALVDEMVLTHHATRFDPEEYGPALCRGSFYLSDEDLIPATDAELRKLIAARVDDWAPIDPDE
jgi:hypothetical protein